MRLIVSISGGGVLVLLLLILMSYPRPTNANLGVLYVAQDGNDGNNCGTIATRCATIQRAVDVALPGDEIRVAEGVYTDVSVRAGITQVVYLTKSVNLRGGYAADDWLTANPSANPTTLDALGQGRVVVILNASPSIQGFVITGGVGFFSGGGIHVNNGSPFIFNNQIYNNSADGDGGGIWVNGGNGEIAHNRIFSNTANWAGGLRIINDANVMVVGNRIEHNTALFSGGGVDVECCGGVIPVISGNYITGNDGGSAGGGVWIRTAHARLVNNILVDNRANSGAGLWLEGMATYPVTVTLLHNTIVGGMSPGEGVWGGAYVDAVLANNIFAYHPTGITNTRPASATITTEFTLYYSNMLDYGGGVVSIAEIHGDPAFLNPTGGDYHIGPGSAALDAGINVGVTDDIDGQPRPYGPGFDLGADEVVAQIYLPILPRNDQPQPIIDVDLYQ
jgi:hypothetical protein